MTYQGMNRWVFLRQCSLGCASAAAMGTPHSLRQTFGAPKQGAKPNIIFFLGDDHSDFDVGCYGNAIIPDAPFSPCFEYSALAFIGGAGVGYRECL